MAAVTAPVLAFSDHKLHPDDPEDAPAADEPAPDLEAANNWCNQSGDVVKPEPANAKSWQLLGTILAHRVRQRALAWKYLFLIFFVLFAAVYLSSLVLQHQIASKRLVYASLHSELVHDRPEFRNMKDALEWMLDSTRGVAISSAMQTRFLPSKAHGSLGANPTVASFRTRRSSRCSSMPSTHAPPAPSPAAIQLSWKSK